MGRLDQAILVHAKHVSLIPRLWPLQAIKWSLGFLPGRLVHQGIFGRSFLTTGFIMLARWFCSDLFSQSLPLLFPVA